MSYSYYDLINDTNYLNTTSNFFDKNLLFVGGSIGTVPLCVKNILATRCV